MTFDEWYDDPATQAALPVKARDVTRAAYEAGARSRDYVALREELAVANERVRQVQADYQYFVEKGESRERAGSRRTLELVQNLAVRIVVATRAAGIRGDSLRAWLTCEAPTDDKEPHDQD